MESSDRKELNENESAADSSDENFFAKPPPRKRPKNTIDHETNPATLLSNKEASNQSVNTRLNAAKKRYPSQKPKSAKKMREINRTGGRGIPIGNSGPAQESRGNRSANGSRRSMTQRNNHSQIDPDTNLGAVSHTQAFEYAPHSDDQPADQLGVQKNSLEINYQPELETANSTQADRAQDILETTDDKSKQDCTFTQSSPGYDFKDQFLIKRYPEILKLIGQFCQENGLSKTHAAMLAETNISCESQISYQLRENILKGKWNSAFENLAVLEKNNKICASTNFKIQFEIYKQNILELLNDRMYLEATLTLRSLINKCDKNYQPILMQLSILLFCPRWRFREMTKWDLNVVNGRRKLLSSVQQYLGPDVMLPPDRLVNLIKQAVCYQSKKSRYHINDSLQLPNDFSILTDYHCMKADLPHIISDTINFSDEVLHCKFSPNGRFLAIGGTKGLCQIFRIEPKFRLKLFATITSLRTSVSCLSWSPNSRYLLVCGSRQDDLDGCVYCVEETNLVLDFDILTMNGANACDWFDDNRRFVLGGLKGQLAVYTIQGQNLDSVVGTRVKSIHVDGKESFIVVNYLNEVIRRNYIQKCQIKIMTIDEKVISTVIDCSKRFLLATLMDSGLKLFNIKHHLGYSCKKYLPCFNTKNKINPTFGGVNNQMIAASHPETHQILIWDQKHSEPVAELSGHKKFVNSVSWNPMLPEMLVSASNDSSIKIWLSRNLNDQFKSCESNAEQIDSVSHCSSV